MLNVSTLLCWGHTLKDISRVTGMSRNNIYNVKKKPDHREEGGLRKKTIINMDASGKPSKRAQISIYMPMPSISTSVTRSCSKISKIWMESSWSSFSKMGPAYSAKIDQTF
uniref:Uncharacterized protein n=1 Tax=Lepeophtheirus salmonis TaxID=72036 RepID=A0A0K2SW21_LEPSM